MNGMTLFVMFGCAFAAAYIFGVAWIIQKAHRSRMELATIGARMISQDSLLPADEQRVVAFMLRRAYSPAPMWALTAILPLSAWEVLFKPAKVAEEMRSTAYGRLRQRPEGERFVQLFALSIMAANVPMTFVFGILSGFIAPFLTLRGGTDRVTVRAVDHMVDADQHHNGAIAA